MARVLVDIGPLRRNRDFRRLWLGQLVSFFGSQLTTVGVAIEAYRLTHSTLMVGLVSLGQLPPLLVASLLGGSVIDATDRRRVLLVTQVTGAMCSLGLLANAVMPHPAVWPLFVCTAAGAAVSGVDWPARKAALPMLIPPEDIAPALALQQILNQYGLVAGPAAAGLLIAAFGFPVVFGIDAASFLFAFAAVALLPVLVPRGGGTPAGLESVREGFRYLRGQRMLASTFVIDINAMVFGMPRAVFPALGLTLYHGGPGVVGLLYAAPAAGALLLALFSGWVGHVRHQGRAVIIAVLAWGVAIALVGIVPVLWVGLFLLAVAGGADVVSAIFRNTILQTTVPEELQGRLAGMFIAVVTGGPRLGDAEAGAAAAIDGPRFSVWTGGLACIAGVAAIAWRVPELWRYTPPAIVTAPATETPPASVTPSAVPVSPPPA